LEKVPQKIGILMMFGKHMSPLMGFISVVSNKIFRWYQGSDILTGYCKFWVGLIKFSDELFFNNIQAFSS